jgi:hypothetical protein
MLNNQCGKVAAATSKRVPVLNTAAFEVGLRLRACDLDRGEAERGLFEAAVRNGSVQARGERAIRSTIHDALNDGDSPENRKSIPWR